MVAVAEGSERLLAERSDYAGMPECWGARAGKGAEARAWWHRTGRCVKRKGARSQVKAPKMPKINAAGKTKGHTEEREKRDDTPRIQRQDCEKGCQPAGSVVVSGLDGAKVWRRAEGPIADAVAPRSRGLILGPLLRSPAGIPPKHC